MRNWLIVHARNRKAGRWGSIRQKKGNTNESRDMMAEAEAESEDDMTLFLALRKSVHGTEPVGIFDSEQEGRDAIALARLDERDDYHTFVIRPTKLGQRLLCDSFDGEEIVVFQGRVR